MIGIGIGLSLEDNPALAAEEAARLAKTDLGEGKIDLAIAFSSINLASNSLLDTLNLYLGETQIIGCSGAAIISSQGIFKQGLILALMRLPKGSYFNAAAIKEIETITAKEAGKRLGEKLLYGFRDIPRHLGIIFSDGLIKDSPNLIYGLQDKLGKSFPLVGGSAADNLRFLETYVYFNKEVFSGGAAGILLGGKLSFGLGIKHGWKPIGKPRRITKSHSNTVSEIDQQPASKIYEEYLGKPYSNLQKNIRKLSMLYPIGIYLPEENAYLLRNVLSLEDNGAIRFQGDVPQGSAVRLMIGTKESCLDATLQAISEAKKPLADLSAKLDKNKINNLILVFNSASRYGLLKKDAVKELENIKNSFGVNTPIIGIYTYGEQAPLSALSYQGQTYFHNQTVSILNIGG